MGVLEDMADKIERLEARILRLEQSRTIGTEAYSFSVSMGAITKAVAERHGLMIEDLRGRDRSRVCAWPRHEAMMLMREAGFTNGQIGAYMGGRDPSSVQGGIDEARRRLQGRPRATPRVDAGPGNQGNSERIASGGPDDITIGL